MDVKDTSMSGSSEQSKLTGQMSSSLPCCNDFINTNQFTVSKDTLSKQIDFFLLFCSPAASLRAAASEALPRLVSVPFALPCSAPRSSGAHCPRWPGCGVLPAAEPQLCPRGTGATRTAGQLRGNTAETQAQAPEEPRQPQEVADGWAQAAGLALCHRSAGDRHGGVKALSLTLLKSHVAWFVCTGWGLPHIFIMLAKCCYHKLQKPTSSSSDQSETGTALHNVSSVSGLLSAPVGHTVIAQRYFSLLLWDFSFSLQTPWPWPVKAVGSHCSQGTCCLSYWPRHGFSLRADMAFPYANGLQ